MDIYQSFKNSPDFADSSFTYLFISHAHRMIDPSLFFCISKISSTTFQRDQQLHIGKHSERRNWNEAENSLQSRIYTRPIYNKQGNPWLYVHSWPLVRIISPTSFSFLRFHFILADGRIIRISVSFGIPLFLDHSYTWLFCSLIFFIFFFFWEAEMRMKIFRYQLNLKNKDIFFRNFSSDSIFEKFYYEK